MTQDHYHKSRRGGSPADTGERHGGWNKVGGLRKGLTSYGDPAFSLFLRKVFIKAAGYSDDALDRPIIGITDTGSDYNPCHGNVPLLLEAIKRGVMLAGGLPMAFPTISIHESFCHPTSMYLRNLMAMDTEEMIRAQPMDAVVLIGGCDKTMPAQMMAAVSAGVPAILLPVGPMIVGHHKGEVLGACTDCRRLWGEHRAGTHRRRRDGGDLRAARAVARHLHGDGHREHHGQHGRGDRPRPARLGHGAGRARRAAAARRGHRPARRRDGAPGRPDARRSSYAEVRCATPWSCCRRSAGPPTA